MPVGYCTTLGRLHLIDDPLSQGRSDEVQTIELAMVVEFSTKKEMAAALSAGQLRLSLMESPPKPEAMSDE